MGKANDATRRGFLWTAGASAGCLILGQAPRLLAQAKSETEKEGEEVDVSPAEDLMREHGALRRIVLIYREWLQRLWKRRTEQIDTLLESAQIIRSFVEQYHEKLEEDYIFPA